MPANQIIQITPERAIGTGQAPFIISEIGNNHNGDMDNARKLIDQSVNAGVDAVKFQTKDIESAFSKELLDSPYTGENSFGPTYREHKEVLELSEDEYGELKEYANNKGVIFFSTPFDLLSVEMLERIGQPIYKLASFHVTNLELIEAIVKTGKPLLMSTGMSTWEEVGAAVEVVRNYTENFVVLQCTSSYPADFADLNISAIPEISKRFDCLVGYSGHERGVGIAPGTVALGACVIERHFTLDRTMKGPDHAASLEFRGLDLLVKRASRYWEAMGVPEKIVMPSELAIRMKNRGY
jgi:sialic acid synthase SpsE